MLAFFLLDMGLLTARNLGKLRSRSPWLLAYAVGAPLLHAALALAVALLLGLSVGNGALLMVLAASASYIAAGRLRHAIPEANPSIYFGHVAWADLPVEYPAGYPAVRAGGPARTVPRLQRDIGHFFTTPCGSAGALAGVKPARSGAAIASCSASAVACPFRCQQLRIVVELFAVGRNNLADLALPGRFSCDQGNFLEQRQHDGRRRRAARRRAQQRRYRTVCRHHDFGAELQHAALPGTFLMICTRWPASMQGASPGLWPPACSRSAAIFSSWTAPVAAQVFDQRKLVCRPAAAESRSTAWWPWPCRSTSRS
jgi:hypothetical protein